VILLLTVSQLLVLLCGFRAGKSVVVFGTARDVVQKSFLCRGGAVQRFMSLVSNWTILTTLGICYCCLSTFLNPLRILSRKIWGKVVDKTRRVVQQSSSLGAVQRFVSLVNDPDDSRVLRAKGAHNLLLGSRR
jgi:hypothetical protein